MAGVPGIAPRAEEPAWQDSRWFGGPKEIANMCALVARCATALVTRPFSWHRDFVEQCALVVRRCALPLALSSAFVAYAVVVIFTSELLGKLGAKDRIGAFTAIASIREIAAWTAGMLVAGIAGTAICSDLGSRKVRDELDALSVLGMDLNRALVLPRALAITVMAPLMYLWSVLWCALAVGLLGPPRVGFTFESFVETYQTVPLVDLFAGLAKMTIIGLIVGVVVCFKGMNARGGAEGVGRSVNQAVVVAFVATWVVSLLFNAFFQATFPETQELR